jgi:hypothetical protein
MPSIPIVSDAGRGGPPVAHFKLWEFVVRCEKKHKKAFNASGMKCVFCLKWGHTRSFCPLRPTEPEPEQVNKFCENLIRSPRVDVNHYRGQPLKVALQMFMKMGEKLNKGNPWKARAKKDTGKTGKSTIVLNL